MDQITIFSPATVANVSCGFDSLGLALNGKGDKMIFSKREDKQLIITKIEGANLPYNIDDNLVGTVIKAMLQKLDLQLGLDIEIYKGFKPGSGLGSSAASAAGTAYAINELLGKPFSKIELIQFAMLGEEAACGSQIADNVSAALFGGFVLIRSYDPLEIVSLPVPDDLYITALHPQIEIKTEDARNVLPKDIPLKSAITQWSNVGGLISGLYSNDYDLISRSLQDVIVEPVRKKLIPHFDLVKNAALQSGALGAGISGAGPTIFALSKGKKTAKTVEESMQEAYSNTEIEFYTFTSEISVDGVKTIT
ncbi:homoserine kinase [Hanstruepera neustonica]|uniref:Homoserine kinase n=1 Tax=Hanstruepera neustonica TaxID=1445657 RepID=A0A2K1DWG3_9FLAO|nr:homoserine kinase [Hanstruepera neustonica]PNQ72368.1 homoserine kinase [Hanstruepera neustonica]